MDTCRAFVLLIAFLCTTSLSACDSGDEGEEQAKANPEIAFAQVQENYRSTTSESNYLFIASDEFVPAGYDEGEDCHFAERRYPVVGFEDGALTIEITEEIAASEGITPGKVTYGFSLDGDRLTAIVLDSPGGGTGPAGSFDRIGHDLADLLDSQNCQGG